MLRRELPNGYALRLLEESDADELIALIDANRNHLERWMPWVQHEHEPADVLPFIRATRRQIAENDGLQTAIVARDQQGRGTMTEAVRAHLDHGFATWRLNRILIQAAVENARSRAIPERLGFREEGILRQVERVGDRMLDGVVYAMLAADWPGRS
jgi:ribosomal-protein-serine acetyltransferase